MITIQFVALLLGIAFGFWTKARGELRAGVDTWRAIISYGLLSVAFATVLLALFIDDVLGPVWEMELCRYGNCNEVPISREAALWALALGAASMALMVVITFRRSHWRRSIAGAVFLMSLWFLPTAAGVIWQEDEAASILGLLFFGMPLPMLGIRRIQVATTTLPPPLIKGSWPDNPPTSPP